MTLFLCLEGLIKSLIDLEIFCCSTGRTSLVALQYVLYVQNVQTSNGASQLSISDAICSTLIKSKLKSLIDVEIFCCNTSPALKQIYFWTCFEYFEYFFSTFWFGWINYQLGLTIIVPSFLLFWGVLDLINGSLSLLLSIRLHLRLTTELTGPIRSLYVPNVLWFENC